ncbi:cell adhesion molecule CEACAM1-like [Engystomops pustulosus]|uniref:cell adhesion molecule CEACAM1-like n=1 Tax=Engystomops pustulosus TaxID=76066 RepID=UPI003AFAC10F
MTAIGDSGDITQTANYQLRVYAALLPPVLRSNDTSAFLINGSYVTLDCDAGTQDVTSYTFYRDEKTICSEPHVTCRGRYLDFTPITEKDSGSYICSIQNPVSTSTSNSLRVTVSVLVSDVVVTSNISGLVWPGIDLVSLRCSARGTDVSYSWSLQGAPISGGGRFHVTENNTRLIISPVSSEDSGSFICTARNLLNSQNSSDVRLSLAVGVSAVTLTSNTSAALWAGQDSVSLYCSARGSAVTFSWSLNGSSLSSNPPYSITHSDSPPSSNLTISPVSRGDTGPFTCTATNLLNTDTSNELNLSLNWFPDSQDIRCGADPIHQGTRLTCSWPGGRPAASVTMIFNNVSDTKINEVSRNVTTAANIQGSSMTCNGEQLGRTSTCVLLFEAPQFPNQINDTKHEVTVGESITLTVDLRAAPSSRASPSSQVLPAEFSWFRGPDHVPVQNSSQYIVISTDYTSSLTIQKASKAESGLYGCTARNFIDSKTLTFNVTVMEKVVSRNGLDGGAIAGIVIGVLAAGALIGIIVFFIMKKRDDSTAVIYENPDVPPPNIYDKKLPEPRGQESGGGNISSNSSQ